MKDKEVKGFDYRVVILTTAWGVWNLYYYPQLNQMFSFYAGIGVVIMNATWLWLVWYYKRQWSGVDKAKWRRIYSQRGTLVNEHGTLEDYALVDESLEK